MHPLRQHTGICNSRSAAPARGGPAFGGGGVRWGGPATPFALPLFILFFFPFPFGGFYFVFLLTATKGSEAGGSRDPPPPPGQSPPTRLNAREKPGVRAGQDGRGWGGPGMETPMAEHLEGGPQHPTTPPRLCGDPPHPFFNWFSMGRRAGRAEPGCSRDRNGTV